MPKISLPLYTAFYTLRLQTVPYVLLKQLTSPSYITRPGHKKSATRENTNEDTS